MLTFITFTENFSFTEIFHLLEYSQRNLRFVLEFFSLLISQSKEKANVEAHGLDIEEVMSDRWSILIFEAKCHFRPYQEAAIEHFRFDRS